MTTQIERQQIADALCALINLSLPSSIQTVKWNAPNFSIDGRDIITLNFSPNKPVRVVFHRGAKAVDTKTGVRLIDDKSGRLSWAADQRAYASFADIASVQNGSEWLIDFCQQWVAVARV